jgi:hypothetical protein
MLNMIEFHDSSQQLLQLTSLAKQGRPVKVEAAFAVNPIGDKLGQFG